MANITLNDNIKGVYLNGILQENLSGIKFNGEIVWIPFYTVTFILGDGQIFDSPEGFTGIMKVTKGSTLGTLPIPSRESFLFSGWYTGENGTGNQVTINTVVTSDMILYPYWTVAEEPDPEYNITVNYPFETLMDIVNGDSTFAVLGDNNKTAKWLTNYEKDFQYPTTNEEYTGDLNILNIFYWNGRHISPWPGVAETYGLSDSLTPWSVQGARVRWYLGDSSNTYADNYNLWEVESDYTGSGQYYEYFTRLDEFGDRLYMHWDANAFPSVSYTKPGPYPVTFLNAVVG